MTESKIPTKLEWMLDELHKEDFYPSEKGILDTVAKGSNDNYEDALVDFILELDREWETD